MSFFTKEDIIQASRALGDAITRSNPSIICIEINLKRNFWDRLLNRQRRKWEFININGMTNEEILNAIESLKTGLQS